MKSNDQKEPNTASKKKSIIQYSLIAVAAITIGVTAGIAGKRVFGQTQIDYDGFNPENYRMDSKELVRQYDKNPRKSFTPAELINIGLEKYRTCEYSHSIGIGTAHTIVDQTIRNIQIRQGEHYFEESLSRSSMMSLGWRAFQEPDGIELYKGKAIENEVGQFKSDNKKDLTADEYRDAWGKTLEEMFIFLISNETVLDEGTEVKKLENGNIEVTVALNPDIATYYYKFQMKTMSSLESLPVFSKVTQTYTFKSDMTLIHSYMEEDYVATMGVTTKIHNTLAYYYYANEKIDIPALDESCDYSVKEN